MKICLVVIFNHKFDGNLLKLRNLYQNRFSSILFIVPFYMGEDKDVITVYESSYQFQGYVAQAASQLNTVGASHYVFIGDDLILNPHINEKNILDVLALKSGDAFVESLTPLNKRKWSYRRFSDAAQALRIAGETNGTSFVDEIPSCDVAIAKAKEFGLGDCSLNGKGYSHEKLFPLNWHYIRVQIQKFADYPIRVQYPLVSAYSDFLVIPQNKLLEFAHLSGVFAAMRLFVEIAVPTALMLIMDSAHLKMQKDVRIKTPKMGTRKEPVITFEKECDYQMDQMEKYWPEEYLYLHPVKLSKWK